MTKRKTTRRYRKSADRRVWVFSDLNHNLIPEQMAKIIARAGLERARLEADTRREREEAKRETRHE